VASVVRLQVKVVVGLCCFSVDLVLTKSQLVCDFSVQDGENSNLFYYKCTLFRHL